MPTNETAHRHAVAIAAKALDEMIALMLNHDEIAAIFEDVVDAHYEATEE